MISLIFSILLFIENLQNLSFYKFLPFSKIALDRFTINEFFKNLLSGSDKVNSRRCGIKICIYSTDYSSK